MAGAKLSCLAVAGWGTVRPWRMRTAIHVLQARETGGSADHAMSILIT